MNFFAIFLEFSVSGRVGIDQNDDSYFLSFLAFPNLFWLEEKPYSCFIILRIFLLFFLNFRLWVGLELIGTKIFIFSLSRPFATRFGLKRSPNRVL